MILALQTLSHNALDDISIKPEPIMHIGSFAITNSLVTTWIVMAFLLIIGLAIRYRVKLVPGGFQNFVELLIEGIYNMLNDVTGNEKKTMKMFPLIATIFIFLLFANWSGLIPGIGSAVMVPESHLASAHEEVAAAEEVHEEKVEENKFIASETEGHEEAAKGHGFYHEGVKYVPLLRAPSSDLNFTFALSLIIMLLVQVIGLMSMKLHYLKKFFNFTSVMGFFVGILELFSEFGKILAFAFRLFGNIFAGEVLLIVMGSFLSIILPMPFYGFELFVGLIQAFVFAILATAFLNLATEHH